MINDWEDFKSVVLFYGTYGEDEFTKERLLELCEKSFEAGYSNGLIDGEELND